VKDGIDWQKFPFSWKNCKQMKSPERLLIPAGGRVAMTRSPEIWSRGNATLPITF
jgi:hypothetical protein